MKIGTRSVLYGAHAFWLHPFFVAWAWSRLYGFPWDPRLWVALFVHDLGYVGKPNMDGDEGEEHPLLGARIMSALFDWDCQRTVISDSATGVHGFGPWGRLCLLHSRFYARRLGMEPSRLCYADKYSLVLTPSWLYLPMVRATGEVREYLARAVDATRGVGKYRGETPASPPADDREWHANLVRFMRGWLDRNCREYWIWGGKRRRIPGYVVFWRMLWYVPAHAARLLFVAFVFAGWGWQSARIAWRDTR